MFNWDWVAVLAEGLRISFELTLIAGIAGIILGGALALAAVSPNRIIASVSFWFTQSVRSIPVLVLLIFSYFGLGVTFGSAVSAYWVAAVVITITQSAYLSDIYRGVLISVPAGQWNAARSLALSRTTTLTRVVIPQAIRPAVPVTINHLVSTLKTTSLASLITVPEATMKATVLIAQTFKTVEVYALLALMYVVIIVPITLLVSYLEQRFMKGAS